MKTSRTIRTALFAAISFGALNSTSRAVLFNETTDAGQQLFSASSTASPASPAGTALQAIYGSISTGSDADLYAITIQSPSNFLATLDNTTTNNVGLDTSLFLLDATGAPIATNDDAPGGTTAASTLPAGNILYASLTPGVYYIGVSLSGNNPINLNGQTLFAPANGDSTAILGAASGLNPATESDFDGNQDAAAQTGNYEIDLGGAATALNPVPEPSARLASLLAACLAGGLVLRRRAAARL